MNWSEAIRRLAADARHRYESNPVEDSGLRYDVVVCRKSGHAVVWVLKKMVDAFEAEVTLRLVREAGFIDKRYYVDVERSV